MINDMEFVKNLRKQQGMTLREMSELTGISHSSINNIEHGKHSTTLYLFQQLLDAFGLELKVVEKGEGEHMCMIPMMTEEERILTLEEKVAKLQFDIHAIQNDLCLLTAKKAELTAYDSAKLSHNCIGLVEKLEACLQE